MKVRRHKKLTHNLKVPKGFESYSRYFLFFEFFSPLEIGEPGVLHSSKSFNLETFE